MRSVSACAQGALSLCSEPLPLSPVLSHSPIGEPLRHRSFAMSSTDSNRKSFGISGTIQKHFRLRWLMLSIRAWSPRVHVWFVWHSSDSLVWFSRLILSSGSLVWFSCLVLSSDSLACYRRLALSSGSCDDSNGESRSDASWFAARLLWIILVELFGKKLW